MAGDGAQRTPAELAAAWGISVDTLGRVQELGKQVDTEYKTWTRSRDPQALKESITL